MAITLRVKNNYGGNLVSQKYQPVETPALASGDKDDCQALVNGRIDVLRDTGKVPRALDFSTGGGWGAICAAENNAASLPPLLVISSNRSAWIASGFARGQALLEQLEIGHFSNISDPQAFARPNVESKDNERPVPAWYFPPRVNDVNRRVYVIVHELEYGKYRDALNSVTNLHVIGWSFRNDAGWQDGGDYPYVGFGASRYAAIEFAKRLRRDCANRWNRAWLVDDNVYHLNSFKGLQAAEAASAALGLVGLGFGSETATDTSDGIAAKFKGKKLLGQQPGTYAAAAFRKDRVLQQAVLWDIDWLDRNNLNFSPYFIASAEDTSITNYLLANKFAFGIATETTILKQTTTGYDNDEGAELLGRIRYNYERWYAITEGLQQVVDQNGAATPQALKTFIVDKVFPASVMAAQVGNAEVRNRAICQAVESIMAVGVKLAGATPSRLFKPNDNAQQVTNVT
ncbi:hypothetical protein [Pseudomonas maumuensis]|uniref:Uncharacterized protein n=1 Tax=Pseudomonas maumuensis TaxID=2842354 RepID=A0ABX8NT64_9PSED|nr:hypothetical protein [Pseudomonas maumuensis]QXH58924.1 hypothetical protein KSS90_12195 [Pseudomonas maumuensis]